MARSSKKTSKSKPTKRKPGENAVQPARLDIVEELLASGMRSGMVVQEAMRVLSISQRTAERYVSKVYDRWETEEPETRAARRAAMRATLQRMLAMALGEEPCRRTLEGMETKADGDGDGRIDVEFVSTDLATAVRISDRLAKLDGLDAPSKIEHSGSVDTGPDLSGLTNEDAVALREILSRAKAKADAAGD